MVNIPDLWLNVDRAMRSFVSGRLLDDEEIQADAIEEMFEYYDDLDFPLAVLNCIGSLIPYIIQYISDTDDTGTIILWSELSQQIELEVLLGDDTDI